MPDRPQHFLFFDSETTGLDLEKDELLEVAWILTDFNLNRIVGFQSLVTPEREDWLQLMDPFVREMHTANGLIEEIQRMPEPVQAEDIQLETLTLLKEVPETEVLFLAGAGVSHFDYLWIAKHFPRIHKKLHYAQADISVVQRISGALGLRNIFPKAPQPDPTVAHRALIDVERSITQMRAYRDALAPMFGPQLVS